MDTTVCLLTLTVMVAENQQNQQCKRSVLVCVQDSQKEELSVVCALSECSLTYCALPCWRQSRRSSSSDGGGAAVAVEVEVEEEADDEEVPDY